MSYSSFLLLFTTFLAFSKSFSFSKNKFFHLSINPSDRVSSDYLDRPQQGGINAVLFEASLLRGFCLIFSSFHHLSKNGYCCFFKTCLGFSKQGDSFSFNFPHPSSCCYKFSLLLMWSKKTPCCFGDAFLSPHFLEKRIRAKKRGKGKRPFVKRVFSSIMVLKRSKCQTNRLLNF